MNSTQYKTDFHIWNKKISYRRKKQYELMIEQNKQVCTNLIYKEQSLIYFVSSPSAMQCMCFMFWFYLVSSCSCNFAGSVVGLKICGIAALIKKHKSIIKNKRKKTW